MNKILFFDRNSEVAKELATVMEKIAIANKIEDKDVFVVKVSSDSGFIRTRTKLAEATQNPTLGGIYQTNPPAQNGLAPTTMTQNSPDSYTETTETQANPQTLQREEEIKQQLSQLIQTIQTMNDPSLQPIMDQLQATLSSVGNTTTETGGSNGPLDTIKNMYNSLTGGNQQTPENASATTPTNTTPTGGGNNGGNNNQRTPAQDAAFKQYNFQNNPNKVTDNGTGAQYINTGKPDTNPQKPGNLLVQSQTGEMYSYNPQTGMAEPVNAAAGTPAPVSANNTTPSAYTPQQGTQAPPNVMANAASAVGNTLGQPEKPRA